MKSAKDYFEEEQLIYAEYLRLIELSLYIHPKKEKE
jgi:hypothetical protein|tara:strand:- start:123 stop:230 length:108 start_codon:yes stop_codon:yes gene_type:complete